MGIGIIVCGLNGSGKSTLGKALSERINFHFIDNENLFFETNKGYTSPSSEIQSLFVLVFLPVYVVP